MLDELKALLARYHAAGGAEAWSLRDDGLIEDGDPEGVDSVEEIQDARLRLLVGMKNAMPRLLAVVEAAEAFSVAQKTLDPLPEDADWLEQIKAWTTACDENLARLRQALADLRGAR